MTKYDLFNPMNREWRIRVSRDANDWDTRHIGVATVDEAFTADSKTEIEYYCEHISFNPLVDSPVYIKGCMDFLQTIMDNDETFVEPEKWRVRQVDMTEDSIVRRFVGVPLPYFWKLWRRPLEPKNIQFDPVFDGSTMLRFSYYEDNDPLMSMKFTMYIDWMNLFDDIKKHKCYHLQTIMPWIHKHCRGRLYLYSDYDTIFEDPEDEATYIADLELCK